MLVVRRVGEQGHRYYLAQIGPPGRGELPGEWVGAGAPTLGLSGAVAGPELGHVLRGCRPDGEPLVVRRPNRVAGLDLVFAAPKSVSVAHALARDDLAGELRQAHDTAVRAVLGYVEREACVVRQGPDNRAQADGLVGAAFRHRVSRADDPHLHTHVLVANLAPGPSGRWSALHTPLVFAELRTAGSLYRAALRHEVTDRLDWGWADEGLERGELLGVPRAVVVEFSQRQMQVNEEMKERHCSARLAADVTRPARHDLIDHALLVGEWRQRAEALGFAPPEPQHRAHQPRRREPTLPAADIFTRADMVRAWSDGLPDGAPVATVERLAEASLASPEILPTTPVARTAGPARLDGPRGPRARFTSEQVVRQRRLLLDTPRVAVVIQAGGADRQLILAFSLTGRDVVAATANRAEAARLEATTGVVSAPLSTVAAELRRWPAGKAPVVIVNRADRLPTPALAELARRAARVDGRVILVGEPDCRRWSETFARLAQEHTIEPPTTHLAPTNERPSTPPPLWLAETLGREPDGLLARCRWREAATALMKHGEHWRSIEADERRRLDRLVGRVGLGRGAPGLGLG